MDFGKKIPTVLHSSKAHTGSGRVWSELAGVHEFMGGGGEINTWKKKTFFLIYNAVFCWKHVDLLVYILS
jgi:hypothetical protein